MIKLILSNNIEIEVNDSSTLFDIQVEPSQYEYMWSQLTEENLKIVKLTTEDGDLIMDELENLVVNNERSMKEKDGIQCHFYLREKTREELLEEKVKMLEEALGVHDGAIGDLAMVVSSLAEEGGVA